MPSAARSSWTVRRWADVNRRLVLIACLHAGIVTVIDAKYGLQQLTEKREDGSMNEAIRSALARWLASVYVRRDSACKQNDLCCLQAN